ncbi:MAG: hypothetical protein ABIJ27_07445 [Candidatus Omnitrophota bacterium]
MSNEVGLKKYIPEGLLVFAYSAISLAYFVIIDPKFYAKNMFNCGIAFAAPLPYVFLTALFTILYASFLKQKGLRAAVFPVLSMALLLPLWYLVTRMLIEMRVTYPYGGNRGVYGVYAVLYFLFFTGAFSFLSGMIFRKVIGQKAPLPFDKDGSRQRNFIFHMPILVYFVYVETTLFAHGFIAYAAWGLALFLLAALFEGPARATRELKKLALRFIRNERLFLSVIFILAFLIRYFWGMRLLGITGENYIIASDDGPGYDHIAATLAQGKLISTESVYGVSGFGYWYFLSGIYKLFGLHNFKAIIVVQSLIGASVPVLTYWIGKSMTKTFLVPVLAGVLTCFDLTLVFLSGVIGMEAIYIPLVYTALAVTVYFLTKRTIDVKRAFCIGGLFGFAYLARPPELLLLPLFLVVIAFLFLRDARPTMRHIAVFLAGFLLVISVQFAVNYALYDIGPSMPGAVKASFQVSGPSSENMILGRMGFSPFEDLGRSVTVFLDRPVIVTKLLTGGFIKRLALLYLFPNFGVFDPFFLVTPASGYFFRFPAFVQLCGYCLVLFGIFGAFMKKESRKGAAVLLAFLAYMSIRVALFYVLNARYRGVLMPVFLLFFAFGVSELYKKTKLAYGKGGKHEN